MTIVIIVMWGKTAQHCRLGLLQDSDFAGDLEDTKSIPEGVLCILGSRTLVPISWMCKKQTSVSPSCTKSEIISLDVGLRMDGLPALDLWDVVMEVLRSSNSTKTPTNPAAGNSSRNHKSKPKQKGNRDVDSCRMWTTSPQTHTLLKPSLSCSSLKTTKLWSRWSSKGRSPTMRHVSRTRRVALDWLFDNRINLDPKIH